MLECLFKNVAGFWPYNFIKKRLQNSCFSINCEIFKESFFYGTPHGGCFSKFVSVEAFRSEI